METKCFCEHPGFSFLGCLQDPTDGSLDKSVSLFMSGGKRILEVATNTAGFYVNICYCPLCGRKLEKQTDNKEKE